MSALLVAPCYAGSQKGKISYYWQGTHTASGERYNRHAKTCAHPKAPFNTNITIHIKGRIASCRVNDRGPFVRGRVLDVSVAVAQELRLVGPGVMAGTIEW